MDKSNKLREVIRQIVREEIYHLVPLLLREALVDVISEQRLDVPSKPIPTPTSKRRAPQKRLVENASAQAARKLADGKFSMRQLKEMIGYGDEAAMMQEYDVPDSVRAAAGGKIAVEAISFTDNDGKDIDPEKVPDYAVEAITKDYSALMARLRETGRL